MSTDSTVEATAELRKVFSAFPSGVVAVCAHRGGEPVGMAVSSFTPVSLDPPLISVCIQQTSVTWSRLKYAPVLGVSILGQQHEQACRQLSRKDGDRFDSLAITRAPSGAIHVRESCAWFACSIQSEVQAGDHVIVVLRIEKTGRTDGAVPLVFHDSRFRRLAGG